MATTKFQKGKSGNPLGRPAGRTVGGQLRKSIEAKSEEILQVVTDAALDGDLTACKILLDKVIAPLKPSAPHIELPEANSKTLSEQGACVIQAALSGTIPPDLACQLINALSGMTKINEATVIEERLTNIEKILETRQ